MTRMSARQYQLAKSLVEGRDNLSLKQASLFNQTTFNSFARRRYIKPTHNGFGVTQDLLNAVNEFNSAEIYRKLPGVELGKWANEMLDHYERSRKKKLHKVA